MRNYDVKGQIKKWYTMTEYVDIDTGELISKKKYSEEYYTLKTNRKIEIHENYGTIKYINECRSTGQTRLWK